MTIRLQATSFLTVLGIALMLTAVSGPTLGAQQPGTPAVTTTAPSASDLRDRLQRVLPADVAEHVLTTITRARAEGLPGDALALRALKFSAKGVKALDIQQSIDQQADRMRQFASSLSQSRSRRPTSDEIEAGAEAIRRGVDGRDISILAKSAPSARSLTVPLYAVASLIDRGVPADEAIARVRSRLEARADDAAIAKLPHELRPDATGRDRAQRRGAGNNGMGHGSDNRGVGRGNGGMGGGPPAGVPANGGQKHGAQGNPGNGHVPPGKQP
jgi:hypothetical protein